MGTHPIFESDFDCLTGSRNRMARSVYLLPVSDKGSDRLNQVKEHLDRAGTGWLEISCDDLTNGQLNKKAYFVIDPMQGDSYSRLIRQQSKIFGCGAIITSLTLKISLVGEHVPKRNHIFGGLASMAMCGLTVCFTNVIKDDRDRLIRQCQQMGAQVHTNMSTDVTYLVVGEVQSKKYVVASEQGINHVTPDWVNHLWDVSVKQLLPIAPTQSDRFDELRRRYQCPIFHGLIICCSNVNSVEKEKLAKVIRQYGGDYETAMDRTKCTHLILGAPGGKKHKYAQRWGFTIVNASWCYDSVKKGFAQWATLEKYVVEGGNDSFDQSSNSTTSQALVEETAINCNNTAGTKYLADLERQLTAAHKLDEDDGLFGEMRFYISGYSERHKREIEAVVRKNSGFVFDKLSASITHVILSRDGMTGNHDVALYQQFNGPKPFVINVAGEVLQPVEINLANGNHTAQQRSELPNQSSFGTLSCTASNLDMTSNTTAINNDHNNTVHSELFRGHKFYLLEKDSRAELAQLIAQHRGQVVDHVTKTEFAVSNRAVIANQQLNGNFTLRSVAWLRACVDNEEISDRDGREPLVLNESAFIHCSFTVVGYDDDELEWLRGVIGAGGGRVLTGLDKRKTTHVITNDKYGKTSKAATKLGLALHGLAWFGSVSRKTRANADYIVPRATAPTTPEQSVMKTPMAAPNSSDGGGGRKRKSGDEEEISSHWSGRKEYMKKLREDIDKNGLDTPESQKAAESVSTDKINRLLKKHIHETSDEQLKRKGIAPFSMSEKKHKDRAQSSKTPIPDRKMKIFGQPTRQLIDEFSDEDDDDKDEDEENHVPVFEGIKLCLHDNLNRAEDLRRLISENGGKCVSQTRNAGYLVVDQAITPSEVKKLTPRAKKMKLVTQKWLLDSLERRSIQDWNDYKPIMPVITTATTTTDNGAGGTGTFGFDSTLGIDNNEVENDDPQVKSKSVAPVSSSATPSSVDFKATMAQKRLEAKAKQKERLSAMSPQLTPSREYIDYITPKIERGRKKSEQLRRLSTDGQKEPTCDFIDDESDETLVTFNETKEPFKWDPSRPQVFMLTSIDSSDKKLLKSNILALNGSIEEKPSERVTCVVAGALMKNEKILVAMARGLAIVPKHYIDECVKVQEWIDQANYEFTVGQFKSSNKKEGEQVFKAIQRWRRHYQSSKKKPFEKWVALLINKSKEMDSFATIIRHGGGTVHVNKLGAELEMPPEVTHVLVQAKQARDPRLAALFETIYDANISKIYNENIISYALIESKPNETITTARTIVEEYASFVDSKS